MIVAKRSRVKAGEGDCSSSETANKMNRISYFPQLLIIPSCTRLQIMSVENASTEHLVLCTVGYSSPVMMLVDSGSDWNLISQDDWKKLKRERREGKVVLYGLKEKPGEFARAYAAPAPIESLRTFHAWVEACGSNKPRNFAKFHVVKGGAKSILGRNTAERMEMLWVGIGVERPVSRELAVNMVGVEERKETEAIEEFPSIPDFIFDFDIDESVQPSVKAYVNIPEAYRDKAVERLATMEAQGIIERVKTAPQWISGLSAVPKGSDDFRLVVNMVGPNRAIRRRFYKMPTLESIKARLAGARFFSKLDLTSAFHHIKLGEKSKAMTTFLGPDGMYRFCRLNFGVSSAPEGFQQKMEEILTGLTNVVCYVDDILIFAETREDLHRFTQKVLEVLKASNLTLNAGKCEFGRESLEFLGHELTAEGFGIAKKKVEDVARFRTPANSSELRSFLGLASFLAGFIKEFANISRPLWDAVASEQFYWGAEQENAFQKLKREISDTTVKQGFFSATDDTYLYTDASPVAVGAVLTQRSPEGKWRVIAFCWICR